MTGRSFPQLLKEAGGERAKASVKQGLWGGKGNNVNTIRRQYGAHPRRCGVERKTGDIVSTGKRTDVAGKLEGFVGVE